MKHLILPIASSPYEGAHQSAIIVDLPAVHFTPSEFILQVKDLEPKVLVDETGFMKRWPS